jgi:hypothetical protein
MGKPIKVFKVGAVEAAIFENQTAKGTMKNMVLSKRYKTSEGEWKSTNSFGASDIPKASLALNKAYEYLLMGNGAEEEPAEDL